MSLKGKGAPAAPPLLKNAALAPVVFFDGAPAFGIYAGTVQIELSAQLLMPKPDGGVGFDMSCVAHLRCSLPAAKLLRNALDRTIAMAQPKPAISTDDTDEDEQSPLLAN